MPRPSLIALTALAVLAAGGCMRAERPAPAPMGGGTVRERIAALALRQVDFGAVSLIPVRFEKARLSGPFEDGGRTLYCVSSRMTGRTFGKAERPKAVIREQGGALSVVPDAEEVCEGHRTEPFPELETAGNRAS